MTEMRSITEEKFERLLNLMQKERVDVLLVADNEMTRDINLQYLSGHPMDGNLIITNSGETALFPWDMALAKAEAEVDEIIDNANYNHNTSLAFKAYVEDHIKKPNKSVGVFSFYPFSSVVRMEELIPGLKFHREPIKFSQFVEELRATKSMREIELLRKAAQIGTDTVQDIKHFIQNASNETENDLSFHVLNQMTKRGAEDLAFQTLVGNGNRAHMLHCHPSASNEKLATAGLGVIDFGAKYRGYHSDITVPFSFGELNPTQLKMHELTFKAHDSAIEMLEVGVPLWKVHQTAQDILTNGGFPMPHSLGHGLGLTVHDSPFLSRKPTDEFGLKYWKETILEDGMVFTIEPGAYQQGFGGHRLENDVAVVNGKIEVLTKSEFVQA
ncbi:MAG: aminopeptidase P family protein [Promethearchaeota archaeon]|nr:MAG: aminopeptidase P family protein [Candidatus Lokiarchaeota archaeon]